MFAKAQNIKVINKNDGVYEINFDLLWEGAWKNSLNCDGVYFFVKYKNKDVYGYKSAILYSSSQGKFNYTDKTPTGFSLNDKNMGMFVPNTKLGAFVYSVEYCENKNVDMQIRVNAKLDGSVEDIKIFTLEMVYVPEDIHFVGDPENGISKGGRLKNCFYKYPDMGAYLIDSEEEIKFAPEEGCLYCDLDTPNGRQKDTPFIIPCEFPKGYKSMWYMKYSLTESQFVDFLNCLTRNQQKTHVMSDISTDTIDNFYVMTNSNEIVDRCEIYCRRFGNKTQEPIEFLTSAPNRACNAIAYKDVAAFACFSGLRLITELEYEKACRGTAKAVAGEFAWGSTNIGRVFHFDGVDASGREIPVSQHKEDIVNCNFGEDIAPFEKEFKTIPDNPGWSGPVSVGLFERSPIIEGYTKRECTGASFYGIMELCGNVWENLVSVGREEGRVYDSSYGNGVLDENGNHTMEKWPDSETAVGIGVRGGVFVSPNPDYVRMAIRVFASHTKSDKRYHGGLRVGF